MPSLAPCTIQNTKQEIRTIPPRILLEDKCPDDAEKVSRNMLGLF